ncbi:binding-protein-dependent transport systems inner membrane component (plasmid) [Rhizobium leguminosarum bv. trifolii WSM2304]|uniref:sn-glycerol-3-phosphate transport system permease protein UgpE n=1 Tax=Rhizobium leguminosarum bv. trifolii (strain WSM2304) TaxID=395492 RepID=A0ABF7QVM3_RHILW|nr:carbohydrate ABC transporter permease [Rhizobium leguminosarum]ACI58210.1 binding-protein-dependent transport systems inner membrane component [Rhizobium leguminosarum bv. trifolii WSM2304]
MTSASRSQLRSSIIHAVLFVILAIWMVPQVYMLSIGLRTPAQAFTPALFTWPITFDNFVTVIRDNPLPAIFLNSVIVTTATVVIVVSVASLFSYACAVLRLRGTLILYTTLLTTLMVPLASLVLPLAILLKNFGWVNTYIGLILPYAALGVPFAMVILKAFMEDAPRELFEAARVDGCNAWQTYWHVALPLVRPALVFVTIWQFIVTWNEFFLALIVLTRAEMKTLTIVPMQYSGLYMANPGALFAILTLIALPLILLYILVQRAFVRGLLVGAVKG